MSEFIKSENTVISFFKDDFIPCFCPDTIALTQTTSLIKVRTPGSGHWEKNVPELSSYTLSISGYFVFDEEGFTANDFDDIQRNFFSLQFRITMFADDAQTIIQKSWQGTAVVTSTSFNLAVGASVKNSVELAGTGELMKFDGLVPCDTSIDSITVVEAGDDSGDVAITYTYTGAVDQIKYRIDGTGNYISALVGPTINILGGALGSHSIEIIPICSNGYAGTGLTQSYSITQSLTCASVITDITLGTLTAAPVYTGTPTQYKYSMDGAPFITVSIAFLTPIGGLSVGTHSLLMIPICSNSVEGTGFTKTITVASQPAQSVIAYNFLSFVSGNTFNIYVNGSAVISTSIAGTTGSITVNTGDLVRGQLIANNSSGSHAQLETQDTTLSSILDNQSGAVPRTIQYTFTANGDSYQIGGTVTP